MTSICCGKFSSGKAIFQLQVGLERLRRLKQTIADSQTQLSAPYQTLWAQEVTDDWDSYSESLIGTPRKPLRFAYETLLLLLESEMPLSPGNNKPARQTVAEAVHSDTGQDQIHYFYSPSIMQQISGTENRPNSEYIVSRNSATIHQFPYRNIPRLAFHSDEEHIIPSGYWKVVICLTGSNSFEHGAFIMDQNSGRLDKVTSKVVTIDEVEKQSGLDLLWELPDSDESSIESSKNSSWISTWVK